MCSITHTQKSALMQNNRCWRYAYAIPLNSIKLGSQREISGNLTKICLIYNIYDLIAYKVCWAYLKKRYMIAVYWHRVESRKLLQSKPKCLQNVHSICFTIRYFPVTPKEKPRLLSFSNIAPIKWRTLPKKLKGSSKLKYACVTWRV